jgi:integrase
MASLGIGSAEALGLQWGDIDFNKRTYSIQRNRTKFGIGETKNPYRNRQLPLSDFAFKILTEVKEQQEAWSIAGQWKNKTVIAGSPECPVFIYRDGGEIYALEPSIAFTSIRKANKLPLFTLHKVRKLFASWAQEQGASTFETARMLGHSTPVTTEKHYTSVSDDRIREVYNMVGNLLEQAKQ